VGIDSGHSLTLLLSMICGDTRVSCLRELFARVALNPTRLTRAKREPKRELFDAIFISDRVLHKCYVHTPDNSLCLQRLAENVEKS
jgi:hypothetical protein